RLQHRFHNVDLGKPAAHPGQLRPDTLALVADTMALDALGLLRIEEDLPATFRVAGPRQRRQGKPLPLGRGALAPKSELELGPPLDGCQPDEDLVASLRQGRLEAVGVGTDDAWPLALVHHLAVEPDRFQAGAGGKQLDRGLARDP